MAKDVTAFGIAFAERLKTALMAGGWEESKVCGTKDGEFWSKERKSDPVHKVWVAAHKHPEFVRVRMYMKSALDRDMVRGVLDFTKIPLKGLALAIPRANQQDKIKHPLSGFSLDIVMSGPALDAVPGLDDPATVADHFHDLILAAESSGTTAS